MFSIKTEKLTKYYKKARGIDGVSLAVEKGDFFGFIGPNGAGKSTTIRTLLGLINKTSGEASVLGLDVTRDRNEILSRVGYMPSDAAFYSGMRVSQVLRLSAGLRGKDCTEEASVLCERLCLDTKKKVDELSFGNKKKVGIVCALQHRPELYILDEPTSGLDPLMQKEFFSILKERNDEGATVFLSSHVLSEVARYCKTAAIIREGRILVQDKVQNLAHTGIKEVTLSTAASLPQIEGARDIRIEGDTVSFLFSGRADELLRVLSEIPFDDINIKDPDLEDVFMHYYGKEMK